MLREIVINTDFIVMLRADTSVEKYMIDNPAAYEGLEKGQKFTRVTVNKGSISNDIIILGSIDNLLKLLDINNKKVIKG